MQPKVSILTASGGRPRQLELCKRWVAHQTYDGPIEHIINESDLNVPLNLAECIKKATGDICVVFEDDDFYPSKWVSICVFNLTEVTSFFGSSETIYYHLGAKRWREISHPGRSSLCATAWQAKHNDDVLSICQGSTQFLDVDIWAWAQENLSPWLIKDAYVKSLKGGPGRPGAGGGHKVHTYRDRDKIDTYDYPHLRCMLGDEEARAYMEILDEED